MVVQKILVLMLPLMLLTLLPAAVAEETYSSEYVVLGAREGVTGHDLGLALIFFPEGRDSCMCPTSSPFMELGGVVFYPGIDARSAAVDFEDALFDGPGNIFCIIPEDSQGCDHRNETACGNNTATDVPFDIWEVWVFVYVLYVTPELDACLGSTGTATVTFS